jgi:hypothetical protein
MFDHLLPPSTFTHTANGGDRAPPHRVGRSRFRTVRHRIALRLDRRSTRQASPGAQITLLNERTSDTRAAVSDDRGDFLLASVQPGLYTVRVELTGSAPYQRAHVVLSANGQLSLGTIELRAGAVTEAVTVNASGTPVQTRSAERSALLTARQMEMIPVLGSFVPDFVTTLSARRPACSTKSCSAASARGRR